MYSSGTVHTVLHVLQCVRCERGLCIQLSMRSTEADCRLPAAMVAITETLWTYDRSRAIDVDASLIRKQDIAVQSIAMVHRPSRHRNEIYATYGGHAFSQYCAGATRLRKKTTQIASDQKEKLFTGTRASPWYFTVAELLSFPVLLKFKYTNNEYVVRQMPARISIGSNMVA